MGVKLLDSFDIDMKSAYLASTTVAPSTRLQYLMSLNKISEEENRLNKRVFNFTYDELLHFILTLEDSVYRTLRTVLKQYLACATNIDPSIKYLYDVKKITDAYKESNPKSGDFIPSIQVLISELRTNGLAKDNLTTSVLMYMGISAPELVELRVSHIDFINSTMEFGNRKYYNISKVIMDIISSKVLDFTDGNELLIKKSNGKAKKANTIMGYSAQVDEKLETFDFNYKAIRTAGALSYYYLHKDEIDLEDTKASLKLYKLFGLMKDPCASNYSVCRRKFLKLLSVSHNYSLERVKMFDADVEVTSYEIWNCKQSSGAEYVPVALRGSPVKGLNYTSKVETSFVNEGNTRFPIGEFNEQEEPSEISKESNGPSCSDKEGSIINNLLERIKKSVAEEPLGAEPSNTWYEKRKAIGDKNEVLVKSILDGNSCIREVTMMKDFSGYDIRFKCNGSFQRVEVKTLNNRLEFHISVNEINSILDSSKSNYVIALVRDDSIYVIEDVKNVLGFDESFIYNSSVGGSSLMVPDSFIIKLDSKFVSNLIGFTDYVTKIKSTL